ncbi:hypothetical protein CsatB_017062 [Cannabis sativa]
METQNFLAMLHKFFLPRRSTSTLPPSSQRRAEGASIILQQSHTHNTSSLNTSHQMSSEGIGGDSGNQFPVSENVEPTDCHVVCVEMGTTGVSVDSNIQLVEDNPILVEETPLLDKRKSKKPIALTSPFMELDSSISSSKDGSGYGVVRYVAGLCPLDDKIGEDIDHKDENDFDLWLREGRRSKKDQYVFYFSIFVVFYVYFVFYLTIYIQFFFYYFSIF